MFIYLKKIEKISHLGKLENLNLSRNKLEKISCLETLKELKVLNLAFNLLVSVDSLPSFSKVFVFVINEAVNVDSKQQHNIKNPFKHLLEQPKTNKTRPLTEQDKRLLVPQQANQPLNPQPSKQPDPNLPTHRAPLPLITKHLKQQTLNPPHNRITLPITCYIKHK